MVFEQIDKGLKSWHVLAFIVIAVGLGAILGLATGPNIRDLAGGLDSFDLRLGGYDYAEAVELLTALGSEGRNYYGTSHLITDLFFVPFFFLAVTSLFLWLTRPGQRFSVPLNEGVRMIVVAIAFVAFATDLLENISIWVMLGSGEEPATSLVAAASLFTGVKWLALAGAVAALAATVIVAVIRGTTSQEASA